MSTSKHDPNRPGSTNPDPITGEPGSHPIGTGVGAAAGGAAAGIAGGALAGAVGGTAAGPIGTAIGAVVGAVAGGLAGKGAAESIDPTAEDAHWRENYSSRPYVSQGDSYEHYQPAYHYGVQARSLHADKSWDQIESELGSAWHSNRGSSNLDWDKARHASRDAFDRLGSTSGR